METRQLGNSDMKITPIGFGAWAIGGGDWAFSWGPQDDIESIRTIHEILDTGVNWIDTAAVYGLGHSEEVVAKALEGISPKPYVFTKCSLVWGEDRHKIDSRLKADSIRKECEASLRRLKTDVIDLYQIHWPNPDEDIEEGWTTLVELQKEGKLRHIAVSNFSVEQMKWCEKIAPITSLQPRYSLIHRDVEAEILPYALKQNIGVIVYSPMASGLLTGAMSAERVKNLPADDWRKNNPDFNEPQLSKNLKLAGLLADIGKRHGQTPAAVSVAWTLANPAVTGAIVGARRPDQIKGFIGGADFRLSKDELAEIDSYAKSLA